MKKHPSIRYKGKKYYQVRCRKCDHKDSLFGLFLRKDKTKFLILCPYCGHIKRLKLENVKMKPDNGNTKHNRE